MRLSIGEYEVKDVDLAGRIGRLATPHGVLETPALLPVIDVERQEVKPEEILSIGFRAVITNAYLIWRRSGRRKPGKTVHEIIGFNGIVMTDSGAYQMLRYGRVEIDPIEVVELQKSLESDIAVILDVPSGSAWDREQARKAVEETLRRAKLSAPHLDSDRRVWVLPVQGGPFADLVDYSARESAKIGGYSLYALGSPTVLLERYDYATLLDLVYTARRRLPLSKPLHLFGAGHPMIIPFVVALGIDMFDSASYILYARDDRYMTPTGTYRVEDLDYLPCSCPICSKYDAKELREMPKEERVKLLALHNLYVLRQAINEVKTAIREGRLWELLEEKSRAHPSLYRAFRMFRKYREYIEKLSPRVKGGEVHGLFLYGVESIWRPEIQRHRRLVRERITRKSATAVLVPLHPDDKPLISSRYYRCIPPTESDVIGYTPFIGVIPVELSETYPLSQFEAPQDPDESVVEDMVDEVKSYVTSKSYETILVYVTDELPWSRKVAEMLAKTLGRERVKVVNIPADC